MENSQNTTINKMNNQQNFNLKSLNQIAIEQKTDKSSLVHNYCEKYELYFDKIRFENLKILEIGVQNGFSLKMWEKYFQNSLIYGIDIKDCSCFDTDRIKNFCVSQTDTNQLYEINRQYGPFDIIIDDGSHVNEHMVQTFDFMFPLLNKNGYYIIEDLHCCYWKIFSDSRKMIHRIGELINDLNSNGKCGLADINKLNEDLFYIDNNNKLTEAEKCIEFIHLYKSICFIKKNNI